MKRSLLNIIHTVNIFSLLLADLILLATAVNSAYQLIVLLPILILIIVYWYFRANQDIAACYCATSILLLLWIIACENIVTIDNIFNTQITSTLNLGLRSEIYAFAHLKSHRDYYFQAMPGDPLAYIYPPRSTYRRAYDCQTCNPPYVAIVDETGYLNRLQGPMTSHNHIDMFLAGASRLEGWGVPSVVEYIRDQIPLTMWNLSAESYGPREKISALINYALPKQPSWLVVEFDSAWDPWAAISDDVCEQTHDFRCTFSNTEVVHRIVRHPLYHRMVDNSADVFETLRYYSSQSLTLAATRYFIAALKETIKRAVVAGISWQVPRREADSEIDHSREIYFLTTPKEILVRQGKFLEPVTAGMALTQNQYQRLVAGMVGMKRKPTVILLYNPSPYELYRDILTKRNPEDEQVAEFQLEVQRAFAEKYSWRFLDLTVGLRQALQQSHAWLYGRYDWRHWSADATATVVAPVLRDALLSAIKQGCDRTRMPDCGFTDENLEQ